MAFDSVFQGPPADVAAPGTAQSPSLGIDVTNKELYMSAGNGWEEISVPGTGTITGAGTAGFIPKFSTSSSVDNSSIDDGITTAGVVTSSEPFVVNAHTAIGVGSQIDNNPGDGAVPMVLCISESTDTSEFNVGISLYKQWNPNTTVNDGDGVYGQDNSVYINLDNQTTATTASVGVSAYIENDSDVTAVVGIEALHSEAHNTGNGDTTHLFGGHFIASQDGTGTVTEDMIGTLSGVVVQAGHVPAAWNFYADPLVVSGTALVDNWWGLHVHAPINTSTNPIGTATGLQLDISTTAGTTTWAINSTGNAPSQFLGPVAVPTLRAQIVHSVAGTPLPSAATEGIGARAFVSDAVANTFNTAYVGGGANKVPVFSNGAAWLIG